MADIIDIVQRLTYQVEDTELQKGVTELQKQIQAVVTYGTRVANLEKALAATAQADVQRRIRLIQLINQNRSAIEAQNGAIQKTIQGNKALQDGLVKEIGLINTLNLRINSLKEARDKAGTVKQISDINKELSVLEGNLNKIQSSGKKGGLLGNVGNGVIQGLGIAGGLGIANLVGSGVSFLQQGGDLAKEVEGVSRAFQQLNQPNLLDNLREATKGTVSDLELMKKAVEFSNFGLPINKLAEALAFARRRAQDTGESVEFIVNSLVNGIARQSPRILDNLGINAKRVRDEFQKIGDFSEAAFKIIQEESAKAGADLETYSQIEARFNAQLENQQAKLGQYYNQAKGYLYAYVNDVIEGNGMLTLNQAQYLATQKQLTEAKKEQVKANTQADILYLQNFKRFSTEFANADFNGREQIRDQASQSYSLLSSQARDYYKADAANLNIYLQGLKAAYLRFNQGVKTSPVNLNTLSPGTLKGLSAQQLSDLKDQISQSSGNLTRNDKGTIDKYRGLSKAIDEELKLLDTGVQKTEKADKATEKYRKTLEDLRTALLGVYKSFRDIDKEFDAESKRLDKLDEEKSKTYNDFFKGAEGRFNETLQNERRTSPDSPEVLANDLEKAQAKIDAARQKKYGTTDEQKFPEVKQQQKVEALKSSYESIVSVLQTINQLYAEQQQLLDTQFTNQQERVREAEALAERGNTAALKSEQEKLDKIAQAREDNAKEQLQLNALLQASNSAVALTEAIGAIVSAASKGDPYTIAARVIAAVAALVTGVSSLKAAFGGFKDGVIDYQGEGTGTSDSNLVRISKGESVMTAMETKMYRPYLESMRKGTLPPLIPINAPGSMSTRKMEKKLDAVIDAIEGNAFSQNINFNEDGMRIFTEKKIRQERRRWA